MAYKDKEKQKEYQRQWRTKRRLEYFSDKQCAVCGSTEGLELDHINPEEKKYQPAAIWGMSPFNQNRIEELEKCQVLCRIHHLEKTKKWWNSKAKHGRTLYGKGCRCTVCFEAQRLHNAQRYR